MKLLAWFAQFFKPVQRLPRRVKFVEGTEWICPDCKAVLATANHDIYSGDVARMSSWELTVPAWGIPATHCGVSTIRTNGHHHEIYTPTGWVG